MLQTREHVLLILSPRSLLALKNLLSSTSHVEFVSLPKPSRSSYCWSRWTYSIKHEDEWTKYFFLLLEIKIDCTSMGFERKTLDLALIVFFTHRRINTSSEYLYWIRLCSAASADSLNGRVRRKLTLKRKKCVRTSASSCVCLSVRLSVCVFVCKIDSWKKYLDTNAT